MRKTSFYLCVLWWIMSSCAFARHPLMKEAMLFLIAHHADHTAPHGASLEEYRYNVAASDTLLDNAPSRMPATSQVENGPHYPVLVRRSKSSVRLPVTDILKEHYRHGKILMDTKKEFSSTPPKCQQQIRYEYLYTKYIISTSNTLKYHETKNYSMFNRLPNLFYRSF